MIVVTDKRACVEQFDSLAHVSNHLMVFNLKKKKMSIIGDHLKVVMFTSEEVWIDGNIQQVVYEEK